jgi:serine/threonine protein kinase
VKEAVFIQNQSVVALKIYDKNKLLDPVKQSNVIREVHILESLNHPNIVKIYDCLDTGNKVSICV